MSAVTVARIPPGEWHDYVTTRAHGEHPAGSACKVSRDLGGHLLLQFPDGIVKLAWTFFAQGIESPLARGEADLYLAW
jgi:hypothetical protein